MERLKKVFLVWVDVVKDDDDAIIDGGYYNQYDSIGDAVDAFTDPVEIFEAIPKRLGIYKKEFNYVKSPEKKSKTKKLNN